MNQFTGHIHVHSMYSALDGLAKIEELVVRAKELGQTFIALTDHGASSGFYEAMAIREKHNFDIIFGEEFYFENVAEDLKTGHLILLAKNQEGLKNIFRLQKLAYDNTYYKPRINLEMLKQHNEGLICTTACLANQVAQLILRDEVPLAINHLKELQSIFGEDLYVELQSSTMEEVIKVNKALHDICVNYNFKPIITNDVHYVNKEDSEVHDVLLCIQQRKKVADKKRWRFTTNDYWLKSEEEILEYLKYLPDTFISEAFNNIEEIHSKSKNVFLQSGNFLPKFAETPEEENELLEDLTMQRYIEKVVSRKEGNEEFLSDLRKELRVIAEEGYSGYFLIVNEYVNWAKSNGITVGDGRGSGAGSKVAYTIGITEINPQTHNLLFERFLAKNRQPDFDTDFSDIDAVFKHLQDKFGKTNVARVGAFSNFTAKSATRKVMSVYGFPQSRINSIIELMPPALQFTLDEALEYSKDLSNWFEENQNIKLAVAKLENIIDHFSTHAGGVIICDGLTEMLPILTLSEERDKLIVALDKEALEALGHFKFDILGLKSLSLIKDAIDFIGELNWHDINLEDENIYNMLCTGDVAGVFQLSEQQHAVLEQQPRNFEDLVAINALIRPGVGDWHDYINRRRSGSYTESSTTPYLNSTSGVIVYQEQYLLLANTYANWDIAFSDKHIRKNKDIWNDIKLKEKWLLDCYEHGVVESNEEAEQIWEDICKVVSSGYGFNRSHSVSYAKLSFQTAYLKYYHPREFYAAYMTQNITDATKISESINMVRSKGITVLSPDINKSTDKFIPSEEGILYPLTCIKGVGGSVWSDIRRLKPIKDLPDLVERRIPKFIKRTSIEALIKAGAFDYLNKTRGELLIELSELLGQQQEELEVLPDYKYEKEVLGLYLSCSPFDKYEVQSFNEAPEGKTVATVVEISEVVIKKDKHGGEMAFIIGTNNIETIKIVIFSSVWKNNKIEKDETVLIKGRKDKSSLLVNYVEKLGEACI